MLGGKKSKFSKFSKFSKKTSKGPRAKFFKKKVCKFCVDKMDNIDYKDTVRLKRFITEQGKMLPSRISGNCAKHQRGVTEAIKRARFIALLPYVGE